MGGYHSADARLHMMSDGRPVLLAQNRAAGWWSRSRSSIRWRLPGECDPAAHLTSRIKRLRYLTIHTIEAFSHRRGIAIESVMHRRARYQTQSLYLLAHSPYSDMPSFSSQSAISALRRILSDGRYGVARRYPTDALR